MLNMHNPAHPGEVLKEYLEGITITHAAKKLGITRATLSRILNAKAGISADMAFRLSMALGTTPNLWLNMQTQYDLWIASQNTPQNIEPMFV